MDRVDETLEDLKRYTQNLVREEMNLGNMIDASLRAIAKDKEREDMILTDEDEGLNDPIFAYPEDKELTVDDFEEFELMKEEEHKKDLKGEEHGS